MDPDGTPVTCRFATASEFGDPLSVIPAGIRGGALPTLSESTNPPGCQLSWSTANGVPGQRYATQVVLESVNPSNGQVNSAAVDYIIELVQSPVPTCAGTGSFTVPMGDTFSTNLIGKNNAGGNSLTISPIYSNGLILPVSGTTAASPFTSTFAWTPGLGDEGTFLAAVLYTDQKLQSGYCSLMLNVPRLPAVRAGVHRRRGAMPIFRHPHMQREQRGVLGGRWAAGRRALRQHRQQLRRPGR